MCVVFTFFLFLFFSLNGSIAILCDEMSRIYNDKFNFESSFKLNLCSFYSRRSFV